MSLVDKLILKQLQLKENLERRKFAMIGMQAVTHSLELEDKILNGDIDPKSYWVCQVPERWESPPNLTKESRNHWQASLVQVVYFQHLLHDYHAEMRVISNDKRRMSHYNHAVIALSETLGWGFYHWAFAESFYGYRERANSWRGKSGGDGKALRRREEDVLLRFLIKAQLERHPQNEKGWPDIWETSEILADAINRIAEEQGFPIRQQGAKLMDEIFNLLDEPSEIKNLYEKITKARRGSRRRMS